MYPSSAPRSLWIGGLIVTFATMLAGADLSEYRGFRIGMDLQSVARQAHMDPSQATMTHQRPALIQELQWRPGPATESSQPEAVTVVVFSFYNGELFRMVVEYDPIKTEGMTAEDVARSIATIYGPPAKSAGQITIRLAGSYGYSKPENILARWQDPQYSLNLVRASFQQTYALVAISRRLDGLAETAITESERLDIVERPQREQARATRDAAEERAKAEKARLLNQPNFRP